MDIFNLICTILIRPIHSIYDRMINRGDNIRQVHIKVYIMHFFGINNWYAIRTLNICSSSQQYSFNYIYTILYYLMAVILSINECTTVANQILIYTHLVVFF